MMMRTMMKMGNHEDDDPQDDPASQVCGGGIDNIDHHPQRQRRHRLNIHGFDDDRENFDDFVDEQSSRSENFKEKATNKKAVKNNTQTWKGLTGISNCVFDLEISTTDIDDDQGDASVCVFRKQKKGAMVFEGETMVPQ